MFLNKIAYDTNSSWQTPLGNVDVDKEAISNLDENLFIPGASTHLKEHAIEVQLPFLQKLIRDFKIVPLVVGVLNKNEINKAAEEILKIMNSETLLIISTDLSHFMPSHNAESVDAHTINAILENDENSKIDACGSYSLKILQKICEHRKIKPRLIEYSHSGRVTGQNARVVGYASFVF
jgi:AmmeMemoRadiSam system protein B